MSQKIHTSVKVYRRSAHAKTTIFSDGPKASNVYYEFDETWERPRGDEGGKHKRRLAQIPTGRKFRYVDHVTPELVEDMKKYQHKDILKGYLILVLPEDFTYYRLSQI